MCQRCQSMSASFGQGENVVIVGILRTYQTDRTFSFTSFQSYKIPSMQYNEFHHCFSKNIELKTKNVMSIPYITIFSSYEATIRSKNHPHCISQILYMAILHSRRFYTTSSPFHQPTFLYFLPLQPSSVPFHLYTYQHDLA